MVTTTGVKGSVERADWQAMWPWVKAHSKPMTTLDFISLPLSISSWCSPLAKLNSKPEARNTLMWAVQLPTPIHTWSPNSQCDGIWRRGLGEVIRVAWGYAGSVLTMGLVPLWEDTLESLVSLSIHTHQEKAMWTYIEKAAICNPGKELSPYTKPCWTLILDFPDSRTVRK